MQKQLVNRTVIWFNALAHPLRLKVLEKLRDGPCCVCRIIPHVGGEQSNVSHHLAILRKANIVRSEKRGIEVWYAVTDPRIFEIIDLMNDCILSDLEKSSVLFETIRQSIDER
ncbi:MAG: metalloregulator ArsR/SmtB family transcription factor [bacterium]